MKLRSPEFGNTFVIDTNCIVTQSMDGSTIFIHDEAWPQIDRFKVHYKALSRDQANILIDFFIATAGQEIEFTDHEERVWLGIISTPQPELRQYGRGCQWETEFDFEGVRQAL